MTEKFTWKHKPGANGTVSLRIRKINFGDGYTQRVSDGLNNVVASWPLTFEGNEKEVQPIVDFFESHEGSQQFYWTPPLGKQSLWVVEKFSVTSIGAGIYSVSADFTQAFTS